jgi:hypothetical protein
MNKPLRAHDFDPYTTIFERGNLRRYIISAHAVAARVDLRTAQPVVAPVTADIAFDAKQNLRSTRALAFEPAASSAEMIKLADAALARQDAIADKSKEAQIEILASDLSKIFD